MAKAFVKDFATYIRAGYPIVTIVSSEEDRALELIDELLRQRNEGFSQKARDFGLPTPRNRAEILMIHLSRRKRAPTDYDIAAVVRATDGFSGAELEELVINALYEAYAAPVRELKTEHLLKSAGEIVPLSRSRAREIATLRQWAETNCRQAAEPDTGEPDAQTDTVAGRRAPGADGGSLKPSTWWYRCQADKGAHMGQACLP